MKLEQKRELSRHVARYRARLMRAEVRYVNASDACAAWPSVVRSQERDVAFFWCLNWGRLYARALGKLVDLRINGWWETHAMPIDNDAAMMLGSLRKGPVEFARKHPGNEGYVAAIDQLLMRGLASEERLPGGERFTITPKGRDFNRWEEE